MHLCAMCLLFCFQNNFENYFKIYPFKNIFENIFKNYFSKIKVMSSPNHEPRRTYRRSKFESWLTISSQVLTTNLDEPIVVLSSNHG